MTIIVITVAVIGIIAWMSFSNTSVTPDANALITEQEDISASERIIIENLAKLQSINLNTQVFTNPAFGQLIDFSRQIIEEPSGRNNPFEKIDLNEINAASAADNNSESALQSGAEGFSSSPSDVNANNIEDLNIDDLNNLDNLAF